MCCFSRPVESVNATKIFARPAAKGEQFVVYSMHLSAKEDLAMILPIPVAPKSADDAVKFINLEKYPDFFADMKKGFPEPLYPAGPTGARTYGAAKAAKPKLEVVAVGSFEASFVPTVADFSRLDERFRLPKGTWEKLPQYKDFGFAVFKLKKGKQNIHPMAFRFPRANPEALFFPTVHIHDGEVHERADFDHDLYCQVGEDSRPPLHSWVESPALAKDFVDIKKATSIVDGDSHCYHSKIRGTKKNIDVILASV